MRRTNRFLIINLILVFTISSSASIAESEIKLGFGLSLTGKGAFLGQQSQAGAKLAVIELEKKGIPVKIIFEDHQADPKSAVSSAAKLLDLDKVDAMLCDLTPTCTALSPVVRNKQRYLLYQSPSNYILRNNPYAFRFFLDYTEGCKAIATRWKNLGLRKIANLKWDSEVGELCEEGSGKVYPDQIVKSYNSGDDLKSSVLSLKNHKIEALLQTGYEDDYINRFKSSLQINYVVPFGMPSVLLTNSVLKEIKNIDTNSLTFGYRKIDTSFIQKLKDYNLFISDDSIEGAAIGYLMVMSAVTIINECGINANACGQEAIKKTDNFNQLLGFTGWNERKAQFEMDLKNTK